MSAVFDESENIDEFIKGLDEWYSRQKNQIKNWDIWTYGNQGKIDFYTVFPDELKKRKERLKSK